MESLLSFAPGLPADLGADVMKVESPRRDTLKTPAFAPLRHCGSDESGLDAIITGWTRKQPL
jgi:hypothetical protein